MQSALLFALALVVRSLPPVAGAVDCPLSPGQRVVAAYSAEFEPIWHHAVPTTIVDRTAAARTGRVTGLGASDRLVLAVADEHAAFDAAQPPADGPASFPCSPEFVRAYERLTGRAYVRDMMVVAAPNLGSQWLRAIYVTDMYATLFAAMPPSPDDLRTFGDGHVGDILVITSRARTHNWLDRACGDDGTAYAQALARKGYRVDLADRNAFARLAVDGDGYVTADGRRYAILVLRHLSSHDADAFRRTFGTQALKTKVYATDAPLIYGAEITWSDPEP
ncbi:MAG: hypothetical protein ACI4RD_04330 [Kiritimatiellia bacterium]